MDIHEAAARLDGNEYGSEGSKELFAEMKAAGLVAVFAYSDDGMEFRGAINDETGRGAQVIDAGGLLTSACDEGERCPYFKRLIRHAPTITGAMSDDRHSWTHVTTIPHATFNIMEDDDLYCIGIVFDLAVLQTPDAL